MENAIVKKIVTTLKSALLVWICVMIPLAIATWLMSSSTKTDAVKCLDSFTESECNFLSNTLSLQFENTQRELQRTVARLRLAEFQNVKEIKKTLARYVEKDKNLISINVYNEDGSFCVGSGSTALSNLENAAEYGKQENKISCLFQEQEDGSVAVRYIFMRKMFFKQKEAKKYIFSVTYSWKFYEKYLQQLQEGSFPRMFYIISPQCKRYVSLNSLPKQHESNRNVMALGMHLVEKNASIQSGISTVNIEDFEFRVVKHEIKCPSLMQGERLSIVIATDERAVSAVNSINNTASSFIWYLAFIFVIISCFVATFYSSIKEQLEVADSISASTPLAIVIYRVSDGKIMRINLSALTLLRLERDKQDGMDMWQIFSSEKDRDYLTEAIGANINVFNYEVLIQNFAGGTFWAICSASPVNINGERYVVVAILDINRRKEIEKKLANNAELLEQQVAARTADLEEKTKELEESNSLLEGAKMAADAANNAKSNFLTNMSNELKTPINAIIGYSEILQEEALDRKDTVSADDLRKIIGSAKHLLSLVDEILDLSNIEAGKTQLYFETVSISTIIKDIEGLTMPLVANNNNSFFIECAKDIGEMYTDTTKLRQCLLNLLGNAAKFTEFGKITLRVTAVVRDGADHIEFAVIDNGVGIDPDKVATIFESFQNNHVKGAGAGLGLSITKKYVEYMGGSVAVESELGVGSKFILRIPRTCHATGEGAIEMNKMDEILDEADLADSGGEEANTFARKSDTFSAESDEKPGE